MEINKYTVEFNTCELIAEISLLCKFLHTHYENTRTYTSHEAQSALHRLDDYTCLLSSIMTIDHFRLNRGDLLLRRVHDKDCEDYDYVCFDGVYFKVVLYL